MKIKTLQISNIVSFKYVDDIDSAEKIVFDEDFNILIGQNGAGKSTVLEVINFILKRVLFVPYNVNQEAYDHRTALSYQDKKQILTKISEFNQYIGFGLERNYDFKDKTQIIKVVIKLDDVDRANIELLRNNRGKITPLLGTYAIDQMFNEGQYLDEYEINIELNSSNGMYSLLSPPNDIGFLYLRDYNLYKEIISIHNEEFKNDQISNLAEPLTLIGGYRNYNSFQSSASLGGENNSASKQIQQTKAKDFSKSANKIETGEPSIFSLVRLKMASICQDLIITHKDKLECQIEANDLPFVKLINEKLEIVNIRVEIELIDHNSWKYRFSFVDIKRNRIIDINSLSAGQKAIVHLVFEAYGRGDLNGGLVLIDEPEIHLHYQFQNEYLRIIEKLNREQACQYILVTHSESLVTSETIPKVIRLSLDNGYSKVNQPSITSAQKWLVKVLDNKRSTYAFFGSKVLLVEGETDAYFFRAVLNEIEERIKKGVVQDIAVLDVQGSGSFSEWKSLFGSMGLKVFIITDLDVAFQKFYPGPKYKLDSQTSVTQFLSDHTDVIGKIENEYQNDFYILKEGNLELYLGLSHKGLEYVIPFCKTTLPTYFANTINTKTQEIKSIMTAIVGEDTKL